MSHAFSFTATAPDELWAEAADAAEALVAGEPDGIANMANVAALIWQAIPDLNWAGYYRFAGRELVLGPFQGKAAYIRIPLDKGLCGAAARPDRKSKRLNSSPYCATHMLSPPCKNKNSNYTTLQARTYD